MSNVTAHSDEEETERTHHPNIVDAHRRRERQVGRNGRERRTEAQVGDDRERFARHGTWADVCSCVGGHGRVREFPHHFAWSEESGRGRQESTEAGTLVDPVYSPCSFTSEVGGCVVYAKDRWEREA